MPICGKFLESVFLDPTYAKYHGRFEIPAGEDINLDLFSCEPKPVSTPQPVFIEPSEEEEDPNELNEESAPTDENSGTKRETEIYMPEREDEIIFQN